MVHFPMDAVAGARRAPGRHKTGGVPPKPASQPQSFSLFPLMFWDFGSLYLEALRRHSGQLLRQRHSTPVKTLRRQCVSAVAAQTTGPPFFFSRRTRHYDSQYTYVLVVTRVHRSRGDAAFHVPGQVRGRHSGIQDGIREVDLDWSIPPGLAQRLSKSHLRENL